MVEEKIRSGYFTIDNIYYTNSKGPVKKKIDIFTDFLVFIINFTLSTTNNMKTCYSLFESHVLHGRISYVAKCMRF